jgi:hypothetical protein
MRPMAQPDTDASAAIWDPTGERARAVRSKQIRGRRERLLRSGVVASLAGFAFAFTGHPLAALVPGFVSLASLTLVLLASDVALERLFVLAADANERAGTLFAYLLLTPVYLLVLWPLGLFRRLRGVDALDRRGPRRRSYWRPHPPPGDTTRTF